jgi:hypothetical protein
MEDVAAAAQAEAGAGGLGVCVLGHVPGQQIVRDTLPFDATFKNIHLWMLSPSFSPVRAHLLGACAGRVYALCTLCSSTLCTQRARSLRPRAGGRRWRRLSVSMLGN